MEKNFILFGFLMILPVISCGDYGQPFPPGYSFELEAGGWLKFHRVPLKYEQAHMVCLNEGAVLASPLNVKSSKVLSSLMVEHGVTATPIFTGMSKKISNSISKYIEGVPTSNTYTQTLENCVGMNADGTKVEISCYDYHPFACYMKEEANKPSACSTPDREYVLDNRTGSCYKVYKEKQLWSDASKICTAQGGHLAVINSQDEAKVIWELATDSTTEPLVSVLIGFRSDDGHNSWVDGQRRWITVQGQSLEEAGYARWFKGEPNSFNENCGSVLFSGSKDDGILNDVSCNMELMFICEIEPSTPETTPEMTWTQRSPVPQAQTEIENERGAEKFEHTITPEFNIIDYRTDEVVCNVVPECDTLDKEYILNNITGSCYKVHKEERTWSQAYNICASEGAHLAVINNQEEAEIIWDLAVKSLAEYSVFIGYRAFGSQRTWVTVQGQTLEDAGYEKWNYGEPNSDLENCGGLNGSIDHGILNDVSCLVSLMFICEIEPRASTYIVARN